MLSDDHIIMHVIHKDFIDLKRYKARGCIDMTKYLIKRILLALLSILLICMITFFLMNAVPGGPFSSEKAVSASVMAALERRFNLDKPLWQQFIIYMGNIMKGDFGISMKTGREIAETLQSSFSISAKSSR